MIANKNGPVSRWLQISWRFSCLSLWNIIPSPKYSETNERCLIQLQKKDAIFLCKDPHHQTSCVIPFWKRQQLHKRWRKIEKLGRPEYCLWKTIKVCLMRVFSYFTAYLLFTFLPKCFEICECFVARKSCMISEAARPFMFAIKIP